MPQRKTLRINCWEAQLPTALQWGHSEDAKKIKGDFNIEIRENFLTGGQSENPAVIPGNAADSDLILFVSDEIEDLEMPPLSKREKYEALSPSEIDVLKAWINQGLHWNN